MSRTDTLNAPLFDPAVDDDFTTVSELDRVADEVDQHLCQPPPVAVAGWQFGLYLDLERKVLVGGQRLDRAAHRLGHLVQRVFVELEGELAGLDLGQIEHVVDQAEQMPAVVLEPLSTPLVFSGVRRRCRRPSVRSNREWR